ncbi:rodlin [Streptomyces sp. NPDC002994]|uniref:rodlin n=1 Tax=Streptomyces sp. NPDC002994 TaxID=3154441 RepID=UPI0033B38BDE
MIKKVMATAAVAVSVMGLGAAAAPQAMAAADDHEVRTASGNGSKQIYGNSSTYGDMSPQIGLIQGSFNKPCIAVPFQEVQNVVGLINVGVQDILSGDQKQQCVENSTQNKGDEALSHILDNLLAGNGADNS